MSLRNAQYNTIMREYDRRQLENLRLHAERTEEIYERIPVFRQLDEAISSKSLSCAKDLLNGKSDESVLSELRIHNEKLSEEKRQLLLAHGYPANYLDPIYTCPDCHDTGYRDGQKCHCFKQAIVEYVYAQSNLKDILQVENFETFSFAYYSKDYIEETTRMTPYDNMKRVYQICRNFVDSFSISQENLLLYGGTGVGKTFLMHCIAKELLDRAYTVLYFSAPAFFSLFEEERFHREEEGNEDAKEQLSYLFDCDLLLLDDLGTELNNSFLSSQLYQCISERQLSHKATVISTNIPWNELGQHYSERVFSRITSDYTLCKIVGEDIRLRKKLARM